MSSSEITPRLYEALQLAVRLHGRDARKASPVPYLAHLLSVCALVQGDGGDEDEAIAALLHDALEDKPEEITPEEIGQRFGERVLKIVELSTDTPPGYRGGPKPPWRERKQAYLDHVRTTDPSLLRVTVADKIDNVRSMLMDHRRIGDELWSRFKAGPQEQLWYYKSALDAYERAGFAGPLLEELKRLVQELESRIKGMA